jgi:hypothetical protein
MASDVSLRVEETDHEGRPVRRSPASRVLAWIGRHPILLSAAIAVLVVLALGLHWWYWPNHPTLDAEKVESIEVRLWAFPNHLPPECHQDAAEITTSDPSMIRGFLDTFRSAHRASEHGCVNSGTVRVLLKDGTAEEFAILPGHEEAYYEYRFDGKINRIDREPFLAALRAIGFRKIKLMPP